MTRETVFSRVRGALSAAVPFLLLPLCWLPIVAVGGAMHAPPLLFFAPDPARRAARPARSQAIAVALLATCSPAR